ncbi:hypothetical protein [Bradyrhizobium sp. URHD0069]|uniref:hypothetical protein n=1 Tax=Bradyrhizobium sp. URHD0069 TaxID=1380355 RepID=UPI000497E105|nr:hypothetical protein [Bradyrhizobium sp. URHD0069]
MLARMSSVPAQLPFHLAKTPTGCTFVSPIGEIKRITHAGEVVYDEPSPLNVLRLSVPKQEAALLITAVFKVLEVRDGPRARKLFCNPIFADGDKNVTSLRFSSGRALWPPIVDAQNNLAPPPFKLGKGYHVRCAAFAKKSQGIVFVIMTGVQVVKAPPEPPPFQFDTIEGGFLFPSLSQS